MAHHPAAWPATREEARRRLASFLPNAGRAYAALRNEDRGPDDRSNVSVLSPYLRHRLITEEDVVRAVEGVHGNAAFKFRSEVLWRTYWKGWLEQHPGVWATYLRDLRTLHERLDRDDDLAQRYNDAVNGRSGIASFDAWTTELLDRGYLHNHARMWYASIWTHTLQLPWQLGADFFMRHLLDGDPASNTLSWRWVVGLHTRGRTYRARRENIVRSTLGRLDPGDALAARADALEEAEPPQLQRVDTNAGPPPAVDALLVIHDDDLDAASLPLGDARVRAVAALDFIDGRSPAAIGRLPRAFTSAAIGDALHGAREYFGVDARPVAADAVVAAVRDAGVRDVVVAAAWRGPAGDGVDDLRAQLDDARIASHVVRRRWDSVTIPYASRGYYGLGTKIPKILSELGIT